MSKSFKALLSTFILIISAQSTFCNTNNAPAKGVQKKITAGQSESGINEGVRLKEENDSRLNAIRNINDMIALDKNADGRTNWGWARGATLKLPNNVDAAPQQMKSGSPRRSPLSNSVGSNEIPEASVERSWSPSNSVGSNEAPETSVERSWSPSNSTGSSGAPVAGSIADARRHPLKRNDVTFSSDDSDDQDLMSGWRIENPLVSADELPAVD